MEDSYRKTLGACATYEMNKEKMKEMTRAEDVIETTLRTLKVLSRFLSAELKVQKETVL